jgi:uncharacterized protein YukE
MDAMCAKTVVKDSNELRKYAQKLRRSQQDLESLARQLRSQLTALASVWDDPQYRKFEAQMQGFLVEMKRAQDNLVANAKHLDKLATAVENYASH